MPDKSSKPGSGEKQRAASANAVNHSAIYQGRLSYSLSPILNQSNNDFRPIHTQNSSSIKKCYLNKALIHMFKGDSLVGI